jgi:hypothetical protein
MSGMSELSDLSASVQSQSDYNQVDFLTTELALCFTFAAIAARNYETGNQEAAETSIANAEKAYEVVIHYLPGEPHSKHLPFEEVQAIRAEFGRVRERLDGLQRFRKGWTN